MSHRRASPRLQRRHRLIIALFVAVGLVNSLDRATITIANPLVRHDLGISIGQMGAVVYLVVPHTPIDPMQLEPAPAG